jgi:hypothetical protein
MGKIYADTSNMQIVNFTDLILQINFFIIQNAAFGNHGAIAELVEQLDIMMEPYQDTKYKDYLKNIKVDDSNPNTPNEKRQIQINNKMLLINERHRELMKLAYRKQFLPSSATGKGGMESEY